MRVRGGEKTRFRVYAGLEHTATEEVLADVGVNSEKTKVCSFLARCPPLPDFPRKEIEPAKLTEKRF